MVRALAALLVWLAAAGGLAAQSAAVAPEDATLTVTVETASDNLYESEMVLLTIHGVYRRHITRETLVQPDLAGFSWLQLGEDRWFETTERGRPVKNLIRRMALYANRPGEIEIGAFTHRLTLLDEDLKWFEHDIRSGPVAVEVTPAPAPADTWFPVRRLQISDSWSNAPDQLTPGEGVLRIIRVEAQGASPDMLPPMPELRSPSALIFPHPEKRLVELSPDGPVAIAFWRWTIQPRNPPSAILEPLVIDYFDTEARAARSVEISAQRIAYGTLTGPLAGPGDDRAAAGPTGPAPAPGWLVAAMVAVGALGGLGALLVGQRPERLDRILRRHGLDPSLRALRRAARRGDAGGARRAIVAAARARGRDPRDIGALRRLDEALFRRERARPDLAALGRAARAELLDRTGRPVLGGRG